MNYRSFVFDFENDNSAGGSHDRVSSHLLDRRGKGFEHYLRGWLPLEKPGRMVDVGCGEGALLSYLRRRGFTDLVGVDISERQCTAARQHHPDVENADATSFLAQHPGEFTAVFALDLLEHLTKDEVLLFLEACRRALRPGGRLVIQTVNGASPFLGGVLHGDLTHETAFAPELLADLLRRFDFREIRTREAGPIPFGYSIASSIRFLLWRVARLGLRLFHLIETGHPGSSALTRVFLITGIAAADKQR